MPWINDPIRRALGGRVILTLVVLGLWWHSDPPYGSTSTWLGWALAWPVITALTLVIPRAGTFALLGDGLLLGAAAWAMGGLLSATGFLIILHAVAVTLFVSYRTGVRLAFWHGLVAMLLINAVTLGLLADNGSWTWSGAWPFFVVLWVAVLSAACCAAMRMPGTVMPNEPAAAVAALAEFGMGELSGRRAAVLAYGNGSGLTALIDANGKRHFDRTGPESEPGPQSAVRRARESGYLLLRELDDRTDEWFASALPGARNVVVVPLAPGRMLGALVVEVGGDRVERRAVENVTRAAQTVGAAR
ncbi:hypothetical protein M1L60_02745 [Actinoplanes sp. TRM 88003]|uniref:Uncharacterized protein n=1 Tax=Paractinoplanes aksuensis TaxID=2939490 RepID=A0ABT1DFA4_9ACTN|nr:hypothetical protein [Actinoplanes aksuensis]MCO8269506.1 hypothetical protein [Actinoplanes aksuensis]